MTHEHYKTISKYYDDCFMRHGDTPLGFGWPNHADTVIRHDVMLDMMENHRTSSLRPSFPSLLDFGCGTGALLERVRSRSMMVNYLGIDVNTAMIETARQKHPRDNFLCLDLIADPSAVPEVDFVVANGVFTVRDALSEEHMRGFFHGAVTMLFSKCRKGLAFNVMSRSMVDWEREDLFYQSFDEVATFVKGLNPPALPSFSFRNDYGLYEFTTYVHRV